GELDQDRGGRTVRDQGRRHLDQRAALDERFEPLPEIGPRVTLRVCDYAEVAASREVVHRLDQLVGDRPGTRLDQQPSTASAERDAAKLRVRDRLERLVGDLPSSD